VIAVGVMLRPYMKSLEEDPDDLIGKSDDEVNEVDEGHLFFGWKPREKKYTLVN